MKEESELKNQPDEIDLDKNSKNFRNLDRPTPPVQAKTAEEITIEKFIELNNYQPFELWPDLTEVIQHAAGHWKTDREWSCLLEQINKVCIQAYHAQFTPSAKSVEVEEADELIFDQPFIDEAIKLYPVTKDSLAGPIENETAMYKAKSKQLVFTKGAEFGANWQQQKQAETISRLRDVLEELANINSTSPHHQELRVKAFGILNPTPTNKYTQNSQ